MKFRTEYTAQPIFSLDYDRPLLLLGSCFADNIGQRLCESGWHAVVNPCGVLYNPLSIARTISLALDDAYEPELLMHPASGLPFCYDFSTKFSRRDPHETRDVMLGAMQTLRNAVLSAQAICVTFGTAWVFERADSGIVVANCHKMPASSFRRRCCSLTEMARIWHPLLQRLCLLNPSLNVIFTVSPVRHLADGFQDNARSKARLLLLCEELSALPAATYFPAYEILTDDLRDYRFYADDLCHPSPLAADYIFGKFADSFISPRTQTLMKAAIREHRRAAHRSIIPG